VNNTPSLKDMKMSLVAFLATLPADFTPLLDGETPTTPQAGDRAFTIYKGDKYIGTLGYSSGSSRLDVLKHDTIVWLNTDGTTAKVWHTKGSTWVGYDDNRMTWHANLGMWEVVADSD
jgi:hypothetical protein